MGRRFRFEHQLAVPAPPEEVAAVLVDLERYPQWWPQVRAVARVDDDHALVVCRSLLPYDLDLALTATTRSVHELEVAIDGDLAGFARWRLTDVGAETVLDYRQEVEARGWLGRVAGPLRWLLRWNHAVMMRGFDRGLRARLAVSPD